jgi:hypothetical protein
MAWIELHQGLRRHKKTLRLAALLGLKDPDHARVKLENLWLWALDSCLDGRLTVASRGGVLALSELEIAAVSDWYGDATLWLRSLIDAGWIDERQGGVGGKTMYLHDWEEYTGRLLARREYDRARKPKRSTDGIPADVNRNSARTVPYRTIENRTEEKRGTPPPTVASRGGTPKEKKEESSPESASKGPEEIEVAETVARYAAWTHPPSDKKAEGVREMRALGLSHEYIRSASQMNKAADVGFWDIVKALKAGDSLGKNGREIQMPGVPIRERGPVEVATVLKETRGTAHKRQLEARKKCVEALKDVEPGTLELWKAEAEIKVAENKIPVPMREKAVQRELLLRVSKQIGVPLG